MTQNRRSKRAIRSRMAQTGEKYTEARRAILASGGIGGGTGEDPGATIEWPQDTLGWFTDQAYNGILLADDEARMLSHATVEPEHILLAAARHGNVERLLTANGVDARQIHEGVLRLREFGKKLELRPRRSETSQQVLRRAVVVAADRGVLGPSTQHLLLALSEQQLPIQILRELGIADVPTLVDAAYPVTRPPLDDAIVERRAAQLVAMGGSAPSPGPIPPIFERFTNEACMAIRAGIEYAGEANDPYVEPAHLLLGVLNVRGGVVATVRMQYGWDLSPAQFLQPRTRQGTEIFTPDARRIVAEQLLVTAERLNHRPLSTGHLLVAILESSDKHVREITSSLPGVREITAAVIDALPAVEES